MVSAAIVHVIGTTALIAVLSIVLIYTSTTTYIMMQTNEKNNLQKITDSLALQLNYLLKINTNMSLRLQYPVEAIYGHKYNIYIGSGKALEQLIGEDLEDDGIYVLARDPSNNIYAYSFITYNATTLPIILEKDPAVFGSTTLTLINKTLIQDFIYISIRVQGVIAK